MIGNKYQPGVSLTDKYITTVGDYHDRDVPVQSSTGTLPREQPPGTNKYLQNHSDIDAAHRTRSYGDTRTSLLTRLLSSSSQFHSLSP